MNINQFKVEFFKLFRSTRLKKLAADINLVVRVDEYGEVMSYSIDAMQGRHRVGFAQFEVDKSEKSIDFSIIDIQNEYRNTNLAMRIFKEFYKIYKSDYWGYIIDANFINKELSDKFKKTVDRYFPPGIDFTFYDDGGVDYEEWDGEQEEEFFGINRKVNLDSLPELYMNIYDNESPNGLLDEGAIYKDITQSDVQNLLDARRKLNLDSVLAFIIEGNSVYYCFTEDPWDHVNNIRVNPEVACVNIKNKLEVYKFDNSDIIEKLPIIEKNASLESEVLYIHYKNDDVFFKNFKEFEEHLKNKK